MGRLRDIVEMMNGDQYSYDTLLQLFERTPQVSLAPEDRWVIFSDLHLGNGGRNDDFRANSGLFTTVLRDYYLAGRHGLILNGDVEELQRFSIESIQRRWDEVYRLFDEFDRAGALHRLVGNHDLLLAWDPATASHVREALRFRYHEDEIFIFHGHQTKKAYAKPNLWIYLTLRYLANPLRIQNVSVAQDSTKQFRTERRVYRFASKQKLLTIIGHTHRPLFESMSKLDTIKFRVEQLCRVYSEASSAEKEEIEASILEYRSLSQRKNGTASTSSLYNADLVVPCMFNSGCVVGKHGLTCLELGDGDITLVHWFDRGRAQKYLSYDNYEARQLADTTYYRVEIKRDSLDYIFTRINLLAGFGMRRRHRRSRHSHRADRG